MQRGVSYFRRELRSTLSLCSWTGLLIQVLQGQRSADSGSVSSTGHGSTGILKDGMCGFIQRNITKKFCPGLPSGGRVSAWLCCLPTFNWEHTFLSPKPTSGGDRLQLPFLILTFESPYQLGCCLRIRRRDTKQDMAIQGPPSRTPVPLHLCSCSLLPCLCQAFVGQCFTDAKLSKPALPPTGDKSSCSSCALEMRLQGPRGWEGAWPQC